MTKIPAITVHGRFQPPLHINHWEYVKQGFDRAAHVTILITNPYPEEEPEAHDASASWRSDPKQNPFSFEERKFMWHRFLTEMGISATRYDVVPFNIKDPAAFSALDPQVPNLVNVYSEWSAKKLEAFKQHGLQVIRLDQPKSKPVSGTLIREIIAKHADSLDGLDESLLRAGFMPQAVPGLRDVLKQKQATRNRIA